MARITRSHVIWISAAGIAILLVDFLLHFRSGSGYTTKKMHLRILPLGDSITEGYGSSENNGYRLQLRRSLTASSHKVEYIGTLHHGSMSNNDHEGYGGLSIKQVSEQSGVNTTLEQKPNLVLLHAGTNDFNNDNPPDPYVGAPERLGSFIDNVLDHCPRATLIVAQIIECSCQFPGTDSRIEVFNRLVPGLVAERAKKGFKIMTVDMSAIGVNGTDLVDGLHPTDEGYGMMAGRWSEAIARAEERGWINEPEA